MSEAVDVDQVPSPPRLPTFGMKDGDQIIDGNGNIFEYNSEQDEWVYHGQIEVPDIVTLDQDGLVYPEVYRKLVLIQELIDRGIDFGLFKLDTPGMTPYYYYFYSSDDLIRFYPETNSRLRLEVDRNRIYQKLLRSCCAGPVGQQGEQGAAGRDGIPASNESFHFPTSVTAGEFEFDTTVATPIDTQISLRLFRDDQILVEYLLQIAGGTGVITVNASGDQVLTDEQKQAAELESEARGLFEEGRINEAIDKLEEVVELEVDVERVQTIIDSLEADGTWPEDPSKLDIIIYDDVIDIDYTGTEINFDRSEDRIWGTLAFTSGASDLADWKYKVRQRGPKGASGQDGSAFLEISEQVLDDPTVRSNAAIVTTRKSDLTNTITYLSNDLPDDVCVSNLALSAGALPVGDILEAKFLAAKVTTRSCKDIGSYQYSPPEYEAPPLELPAWEPTQDCVTAARFSSYKFEWWDLTDPKYPYRIVTPPRPNDQCCQEPFFWCPNVGDNPCGVNHWRCGGIEKLPSGAANAQGLSCNGEPREPILKPPAPKAPECDCDCDSPLAFELQNGGFSLGTIELGPPPTYIDAYSNSEPSVIDGRTDTFKANFKASGQIDVSVNLEWNSAVCGGEKEKENCQYQENCEVHTTIVFEDNNKNADISGGGVAELSTLPGSASFTVRPLAGSDIDVVINVMVNDTRSQCCRGYEIRLAAAYTDADAFSGGTPDVEVVDGNWVPL